MNLKLFYQTLRWLSIRRNLLVCGEYPDKAAEAVPTNWNIELIGKIVKLNFHRAARAGSLAGETFGAGGKIRILREIEIFRAGTLAGPAGDARFGVPFGFQEGVQPAQLADRRS